MQNLTIDGPVGPLEALFQTPGDVLPDTPTAPPGMLTPGTGVGMLTPRTAAGTAASTPAALLAHPHPQMGGTMNDTVLDTVAGALLERGISCLRFNFRGAGASAGTFDGGDGERDDLAAALRWLAEETSAPVWLVGYSFGSWVGWRVAAEAPATFERIIMIAPPIGRLDYPDWDNPGVRVQIIYGGSDDFVDAAMLCDWAERNAADAPVEIVGAGHFFRDHTQALCDALDAAVA
jgi:alpha/beta superfamily hydrolase